MIPVFAGALSRARALWRAVAHRRQVELDIRDEFQHHLAERTAQLVREGLTPTAAEAQARREFGHQGTYLEQARAPRGLDAFARLRFSWLDVKLALRRLPRHPVLNLAALFALAVGIPVGLAPGHLARALEAPLPVPGGDRLRAIRYWNRTTSDIAPTWYSDFAFWQDALNTFSALGAFRTSSYNLVFADGVAVPVDGAQVTSSILPMLGAQPVLGRAIQDEDFAAGAPDVVVIGHGLWSSRFGQDPQVVGRTIRIGRNLHVVVGVMPNGFAFPTTEALWLPLRVSPGEGGRVHVLGRLADGVAPQAAQAQLSSLLRAPPSTPTEAEQANERMLLHAEVVPFGFLYLGLPAGGLTALPEFRYVQALMVVLLLVACGNVAMLVFARTATRLREFAIRTALGASRARIVSQVFAETLLLAVMAAGVGLVLVQWALAHVNLAEAAGLSALPYWLRLDLSTETAFRALTLSVVSATVAGVGPAIVITGRAFATYVRGGAPIRFGRVSSTLVVADIAVSVAAVGLAIAVARHATDAGAADRMTGIRASEYLAVELRLPQHVIGTTTGSNNTADRARLATVQRTLIAALEREPGVRSVAVADVLPREEFPSRTYELDRTERVNGAALPSARVARVDAGFFGAIGTRIVSGRDFAPADTEGGSRVAIVNRAFVARALDGQDPIGRRVRLSSRAETGDTTWYQIVGVVGPLGVNLFNPDRGEAVYLPAAPGTLNPMHIAVRTALPPAALIGRVREAVRATEPELVLAKATALDALRPGDWYLVMGLAAGLLVLVGVLVALATSGLYAMLSLSVTERTREIGIRAALGASRGSLLFTILRRSLIQIGVGAAIGLPLAARSMYELTNMDAGGASPVTSLALALGLAAGVVGFVALSSCLVPGRRILGIQAREAMHADG